MGIAKKWVAALTALVMLLPAAPFDASAEETEPVSIRVSDGTDTTVRQVILEENEIYFPAEAYGEMTAYWFTEGEKYGYQLGAKTIVIDPENGDIQIPVQHYKGNIGAPIALDGTVYLPASVLLPWMNVTCSVENGVLKIVPDSVSVWTVVDDLDYSTYMYNLLEQYGDSVSTTTGLTAMYMFDTIANLRWDRLIPAGEEGSLYDYRCYVDALSELGGGDVDGDLLDGLKSHIDANDNLDNFSEVIGIDGENIEAALEKKQVDPAVIQELLSLEDVWEEIRACAQIPGVMTKYYDIFAAYKTYELILETDNEYREYLRWLSDRGTGNDLFDRALEKAQTTLDENNGVIYTIMSEFSEEVLSVVPPVVFQAIANHSMDDAVIGTFNTLASGSELLSSIGLYTSISNAILKGLFPDLVDGIEGMAKVNVLSAIQDHCWFLAGALGREELTAQTITNIRQSYLTALRASRQLFVSQQLTFDFGVLESLGLAEDNKELLEPQLKLIDMKIQRLMASADATEHDSVDGKQEAAQALLELFAQVPYYRSFEELMFDETYWTWSKGVTAGASYAVLFHLDGTLNYCRMNEEQPDYAAYSYENGFLKIDGVEYGWQDDRFTSIEKFEVNGSDEPVNYFLYPDEQKQFCQLVPSFSMDHFADEIQMRYGKASHTEFISCIGTWIQQYPEAISGFLTEISVDLNEDGTNERLALISEDGSIKLQVYAAADGKYMLLCETWVSLLDYGRQQNISLFYSEKAGGYLLFCDACSTGAYTGVNGYFASLYRVTPSCIELYGSINEMDYNTEKEDVPAILEGYGVPYAQNCAQIDSITSQSWYAELLEVRHRYYNADPLGGWAGREHHLQLLTPEKKAAPSEAVQTWTITAFSYQGFTEYREESWTREFEDGKVYTLEPTWKDGKPTEYSILSYEVDTQEKAIRIFMDYPEGDSHWQGLVLDLADHTYYGLGYTEFGFD